MSIYHQPTRNIIKFTFVLWLNCTSKTADLLQRKRLTLRLPLCMVLPRDATHNALTPQSDVCRSVRPSVRLRRSGTVIT